MNLQRPTALRYKVILTAWRILTTWNNNGAFAAAGANVGQADSLRAATDRDYIIIRQPLFRIFVDDVKIIRRGDRAIHNTVVGMIHADQMTKFMQPVADIQRN